MTATYTAEQPVKVYDHSARPKGITVLDGKIIKVGRTLVTITYWHPDQPQYPYTSQFRMAGQGINNDFGGLRFRTLEQAALHVRYLRAEAILRERRMYVQTARLSETEVIAMAAALEPGTVVIKAAQLTPELRESLSKAAEANRMSGPKLEWLEDWDEATGGWPIRSVRVAGVLA